MLSKQILHWPCACALSDASCFCCMRGWVACISLLCFGSPHTHVSASATAAPVTCPHAGGLSENDFIMAAKINAIDMSDLKARAKKQYWA